MPADPPIGHPRLVKLVRDYVGGLLPDSTVTYRKIDDRETLRSMLRAKLLEEMAEYLRNPSLGELADIHEAVRALCVVDLGCQLHELEEEAREKRIERGGFDGGMGMWVTTSAGPRHEGEHVQERLARRRCCCSPGVTSVECPEHGGGI
jgi:predicted house-cleaning noncanonical NTP pyrophosphatase (MazG superfamily)